MSMGKCRSCNKSVAINAESCPHCGFEKPMFDGITVGDDASPTGKVLGWTFIVLGGMYGLYYIISGMFFAPPWPFN